jgi:hypothetical protein
MENHTFDNLFGNFPGSGWTAAGATRHGLPPPESGPFRDELFPLDRRSDATADTRFYRATRGPARCSGPWRTARNGLITDDQGGGFWDHVAPRVKTCYGYGTWTAMVIVCSHARTGISPSRPRTRPPCHSSTAGGGCRR